MQGHVRAPSVVALVLMLSMVFARSASAEAKVELLWPAGAPGAKGDTENDKPTLSINLAPADKAVGTAVVVCPGGGYGALAMDHEGKQIAEWFNSMGVSAFILKYRHSGTGYRHPAPLQDAQRAIRTVRARAEEFGIDPARVGIMGFSAGGHLASTTGTHFDAGKADADDKIEQQSSRPDFMILRYPVISFTESFTHTGSKNNLLGNDPSEELVRSLSNDLQVTAETPPTFLFHTSTDEPVPPENSVVFYMALQRHKVPAELHIYERGPHGVGLAQNDPILSTWPKRCEAWLGLHGMLEKAK